MKLRCSSFLQTLRELRSGFSTGISEFIRASREVQEELGVEPPSERAYFAFFRAAATLLLLCGYAILITLLVKQFG